jgi:hypothetical protein
MSPGETIGIGSRGRDRRLLSIEPQARSSGPELAQPITRHATRPADGRDRGSRARRGTHSLRPDICFVLGLLLLVSTDSPGRSPPSPSGTASPSRRPLSAQHSAIASGRSAHRHQRADPRRQAVTRRRSESPCAAWRGHAMFFGLLHGRFAGAWRAPGCRWEHSARAALVQRRRGSTSCPSPRAPNGRWAGALATAVAPRTPRRLRQGDTRRSVATTAGAQLLEQNSTAIGFEPPDRPVAGLSSRAWALIHAPRARTLRRSSRTSGTRRQGIAGTAFRGIWMNGRVSVPARTDAAPALAVVHGRRSIRRRSRLAPQHVRKTGS